MHVVMGASGNTGPIVETNLLTRGQRSRHRQKLSSFTASCVNLTTGAPKANLLVEQATSPYSFRPLN